MGRKVTRLLFLLGILCAVQIDCEIYEDRPKIKTSDGDLILEPALDKNIYLRANGPQSSIFIGDIDVLKKTNTKSSIQNQPIPNFDEYLSGPNGILERLQMLENKTRSVPDTTLLNITLLWQRVNRLRRTVMSLQNQINTKMIDQCQSQPCQHGGTCLNLLDGYHCLCPSNWEGKDCDMDVNECRNFAGTELGCQNGAQCINRPGTYECLCKSGWYGLHCTRKAKDCSGGDFEMCGYGSCIPVTSGEGIKCICHQGWTTNATSVACFTDINECESYQGPRCSVNPRVECINLPGSFRCGQCPRGYEGDGYVCNDIDECVTMTNGGCSPLVKCHNTVGSRICGPCPPGYQGDGETCTFRGTCNINHGGCHPSARCVETISPNGQTSQCICPEGMDGDGIGDAGCYVSHMNYTNGCQDNPCGSHGRCHTLISGYTCLCHRGYGGAHCDIPTNVCVSNPCQNGGICKQDDTTISGFRCECSAQYTGSLCQVKLKSCGAILDAEEGSIAYPLWNTTASYNNNAQCAWVIHTVPDKVINVTFSKFNVELAPECSSDFLQIHDGRKSSSQLIGRFCGSTLPNGGNIVSSHNNLYLWFHSDGSITKAGFALHWVSIKPVCGGEVDATTHGHISSPGSPGSYPPNRDCYWHLSTTPGKRLSLHFFALDIEAHTNCSFDYLAIYEGEHTTDPILSKYCNSTLPAPVQSAGSDLLIHFHSDAYNTGKGFQITYAPIEGVPGCGGYFTADKGEIVSPTYNGAYQPNLLCEYKIKTAADTRIKINFKSFKLERSHRCRYDYLKVYDGSSPESQLVGKFCGTTYPATYTSTTNMLFIIFKTDRNIAGEGFRITYETVCEQTFIGNSGVIKSPSYPFEYPRDKQCVYIIKTDPGKLIQLTFQDFDIEDSRYYDCRYDYVEVRDGHDSNSTLLGRFCGGIRHIPPVQISTYNYMYVKFNSDMTLSGTGFYANYTTTATLCGGIYKDTTGLINYPSGNAKTYSNNQACQWLLIAPEGMHIKLTWNRFDLEDMPDCDSDYLQIFEIDDNNETYVLGNKYCGNRTPPALTTSTNRLTIKFFSDSSINHAGFSVSYSFLDESTHCGGNYYKAHGYIYSPGWPHPYEPNRDCSWIITVPIGQQISLNISNFDLEQSIGDKCNLGDYLEIRNGGSDAGTLIGQFCGSFRYKRVISFANVLYLHFHSDFYLTRSGFKIEWDGTITGCGGTLTSSTGSISSPNYPNEYHNNAECFYRIVTSAGSRISIVFRDLDLERSRDCQEDYVEIYDGRDAAASSLGKRCSLSSTSTNVESSSNYAFIKFRSDLFVGGKGFMLNYHTVCNNNVTGRYGVIESPDYPNNYPLNLQCLWTIQVPKGNKINVTFTHFDIYQYNRLRGWRRYHSSFILDNDCHPDYLEIKDLSEPSVSKKLCGNSLPSPITTKGNSLQLRFSSGFYAPRTGFRLEWVSYGCGGHIKKLFGTISLDKSLITEKEIACEWLIETDLDKSISITFHDIYMLDSKNCTTDSIEIYNGQSTMAPLISKICHQSHTSIESDSNYMFIRVVKQSTLRDVHFTSTFRSLQSKCGGLINSMSGYLHSKNYPKNYDNNLDCMWFIKVPSNHRIEINFVDLDLYSSSYFPDNDDNCGDTILIYDNEDYTPSSNYSYRICPSSNKTQIVTNSNNVAIQFKTDDYGTAKGFKANFSVTCGAVINAAQDGIIKSNKFINHVSKSCVWTIIAPKLDEKISITLTHISIPKNSTIVTNRNCPSSFLRVLDGNDKTAPQIGEYCGRKIPNMIVSQGNTITIELGSYTDKIVGTFEVHYSPISNTCGGTLIAEEGTIASPSYPSPYPADIDCEWVLQTSPGNMAYIAFEQLDLEFSEGCNEDYLEIREDNGAGPLFGAYCGNNVPSNITKASKIYIKFHSDSKSSGQGFLLHYAYLHENVVEGDSGVISSPLYPVHYEGTGEYRWRILTSGADFIVLTIDRLQIPSHGENSYNKLTIYDGYDETAPILEQLHGVLDDNKIIQTSSSVVYIVLTMDESNIGSFFYLLWTKSTENEEPEGKINCGSNQTELILAGQTRFVQSPNYPEDYSDDLNCEWVYSTSTGRHLSVRFRELNLEETQSCFADSISIYSAHSPGNWKPVKESICASTSVKNEVNSSNYMKITFKSDSSITKTGFRAQVKSKCGGLITDLSGEISPNWADSHAIYAYDKVKCDWTVKVRPGRMIQLNFVHFNITNKNDDCTTYVVLRNGDSLEAPLLESGKYCGYEHEKKTDIITSSNSLFISYTSSYLRTSLRFQSFKIHFEEKNVECGATSKLTHDNKWETISSPNYPSIPIPYSECIWIFTGPPGEIIRIDFLDRFDLDDTDGCGTESIEIRDGSSNLSPLIKGPYCGEKPGTIKSTGNTMFVKYLTQLTEPRNGFKANISIDICGGTIIGNSGILTSPGYPHMQVFPYGTVCQWRIIGTPRRAFLLNLQDIELPQSETNCATKIEIEETIPVNNTLTILKTICDDDVIGRSTTVQTISNNFTIKLTYGKSDSYDQISEKRGFRISFNTSRPVCGGKITTSEGYLTTPNYPQETSVMFCQWSIEVPHKSRRVRLELIDVDKEKHSISIFNDLAFQSLIQSIPGDDYNAEQTIYESVGNTLAIYIFRNRFVTSHRFKAKFTSDESALCGGDLTGLSQELVSPDIQHSYSCNWRYNNRLPTENQNNFTYNSIFVSASVNSSVARTRCRFFDSKIIIKSPIINSYPTIRRDICGNTETTHRLPFSTININAIKTKAVSLYFHLNLKLQPCGGTIQVSEEMVNIFDNIPDFYNDTLDCSWILIVPGNSRVEIKMDGSFLLDCPNEYVTVMQGLNQNAPVIGDYCKGKFMETPLTTHYSYMYIQYHSDIKNRTSIKLTAKTVNNQCGGLLTQYQKMFMSPNYPKSYNPNQECSWEIRADIGYRVSLHFVDRFVIEDRPNCTKDVVIIYDWKDHTYQEMGRICGRNLPMPFNSTFNRLKVVLRTDADTNLDGFKATWVPICGGQYVASDKEQILYSPGYPLYYHHLLNCMYEITAPNEQKVHLKFLDFELEDSPECFSDNLTITAESPYNELVQVLCGIKMPADIRKYGKLSLLFKTDQSLERKGFKISYSIFTCGGKINDTTMISSNLDDDEYDENMNCTWNIEAPSNKIVVVKILYIDLESHMDCYNDYIALYDGSKVDGQKRLALLCGSVNASTVIRSKENHMVLEFITDYSVNYKGFKAVIYFSYSNAAGCGGPIDLTKKSSYVLKSPLIGNNVVYENYLDCNWIITSPPDTVIKISFTKFHISPCKNINQTAVGYSKCDCDLVEVRDGFNPISLLIGTYCGHTFPPDLVTSENMMSVRLSTDGELVSSGFEATLTVHQTVCGHTIIPIGFTPHRFQSPGYEKGSIARGLHCLYRLENSASEYSQVRITVRNLKIRPASVESGNVSRCNQDKLIISSSPSRSNNTLGKDLIINNKQDDFFSRTFFYDISMHMPSRFELCGNKEAVDFYVYGSTSINIITSSDTNNVIYKGAEIEVAFVGFCGRNYSELQGRVQSYYGNNDVDVDCYTLITVPENFTISAYFLQLIPEYWDEQTFLEIFDGNKTSSKSLVKIHSSYGNNYPVFSTGRYMLLHNHQNENNRLTFDMNYIGTDKSVGCGGKLINIVGTVTSPNYPNTYRHKSVCEWELETPVGTRLLLRFNDFDLGITCEQNYVQLVDSSGVVVRTFCSETPADYTSTDNYVKLVFYTTMNNSGKGWTAYFIGTNL